MVDGRGANVVDGRGTVDGGNVGVGVSGGIRFVVDGSGGGIISSATWK